MSIHPTKVTQAAIENNATLIFIFLLFGMVKLFKTLYIMVDINSMKHQIKTFESFNMLLI